MHTNWEKQRKCVCVCVGGGGSAEICVYVWVVVWVQGGKGTCLQVFKIDVLL